MGEQRPDYVTASVVDGWVIAAPQPITVTLTRQEIKLILRLRQAAAQGRMMLVDPDAMTLYLVGPMECPR